MQVLMKIHESQPYGRRLSLWGILNKNFLKGNFGLRFENTAAQARPCPTVVDNQHLHTPLCTTNTLLRVT